MVSLSDPKCQVPVLRAMAIAPKCTGIVSLISSTFIIQHVLRDRKRRSLTYHRLLLGMSISDFFGSLMCFLGTWPIPRGEACLAAGKHIIGRYVWMAGLCYVSGEEYSNKYCCIIYFAPSALLMLILLSSKRCSKLYHLLQRPDLS